MNLRRIRVVAYKSGAKLFAIACSLRWHLLYRRY